jgi:hypothetical protein
MSALWQWRTSAKNERVCGNQSELNQAAVPAKNLRLLIAEHITGLNAAGFATDCDGFDLYDVLRDWAELTDRFLRPFSRADGFHTA